MPLCATKFAVFSDVMTSFANELKQVFPVAESTDKPHGEIDILLDAIREALIALDEFEATDALAVLHKLDGFTFGEETDAAMLNARNAAEAFNYEKAALFLKQMI